MKSAYEYIQDSHPKKTAKKDPNPPQPKSGMDYLARAHKEARETAEPGPETPKKAGGQSWAQVMITLGKDPVQPAARSAPLTQEEINKLWIDFWNSRGARPPAGTRYIPEES